MSVLQPHCSDFCLSHDLFCSFPKWAGRGGRGKAAGAAARGGSRSACGAGLGGGQRTAALGCARGKLCRDVTGSQRQAYCKAAAAYGLSGGKD